MKFVRLVVRAGDPRMLADVVRAAGLTREAAAAAVSEGRVFVGRRRARAPEEPVAEGDEIRVATASSATAAPAAIRILHRDADWIVLDKPAGIVTIPDHGGTRSLLAEAAAIAKAPLTAVHPTSRLDRGVSGVVVFARTARARERAKRARDEGAYERRYVAIGAAAPDDAPEEGLWRVPIGRAADPRLRAANGRDATPAETRYRRIARAPASPPGGGSVARAGAFTLFAFGPRTGRTHQLRVHAAHAKSPLLGDKVYGGATRVPLPSGSVVRLERIALHAARVVLADVFAIASPIPEELASLWTKLGGEASAWDTAVSCAFGGCSP